MCSSKLYAVPSVCLHCTHVRSPGSGRDSLSVMVPVLGGVEEEEDTWDLLEQYVLWVRKCRRSSRWNSSWHPPQVTTSLQGGSAQLDTSGTGGGDPHRRWYSNSCSCIACISAIIVLLFCLRPATVVRAGSFLLRGLSATDRRAERSSSWTRRSAAGSTAETLVNTARWRGTEGSGRL